MENLPKALVGVHLLHWIATYPVDKVIPSLNNWGQNYFCTINIHKAINCFEHFVLDLCHSFNSQFAAHTLYS